MNGHIAVIGLGTMGSGIVQVFATAGHRVRCFDSVPAARQSLKQRVAHNDSRMREAGISPRDGISAILDRIEVTDTEDAAVAGTGFVIEAVAEELQVKQHLIARLETVLSPTAIIATNTSSLRLADMSAGAKHPERMVVTHWFNPAQVVPVVEVVPGPSTSEATIQASIDLLRNAGKTPVRLNREIPGFIVNRVQVAMLREVIALLESGVASAADIDTAVRGSMGFRLAASGPLEVCDFGGLDIWKRVYANLAPQIRSDTQLPESLTNAVADGRLGTKSGHGFHNYPASEFSDKQSQREARLLAILKLLYSDG